MIQPNFMEMDHWQSRESEAETLFADLTESDQSNIFFDGLTDRDTGLGRAIQQIRKPHLSNTNLTGGELDDDWYDAEVGGEEAVGGSNPTPDQNVTEDLLISMGIPSADGQPVQTLPDFLERDQDRWELEPESAEDYGDRED